MHNLWQEKKILLKFSRKYFTVRLKPLFLFKKVPPNIPPEQISKKTSLRKCFSTKDPKLLSNELLAIVNTSKIIHN